MPIPVLISRCLLGECCRYSGVAKPSIVPKLAEAGIAPESVRFVPVCPEVEGGLPVPRPPCEIEPGAQAADVLCGRARILSSCGSDSSEPYVWGARAALSAAEGSGAQMALLKARSPACSPQCVYDGSFTGRLIPGRGIAAELLFQHGIALFSEEMLADFVRALRQKMEEPAC